MGKKVRGKQYEEIRSHHRYIAVILLIPIITFNYKPEQISVIDNRKLAELPTVTSDTPVTDLIKELNSYVNDRIGLRDYFITSSVILQDKLFGVLVHPLYTNGKEGYVFLKLNPQLTDFDYINEFVDFVAKLQDYCRQRNAVFLFSLEPSKQIVYEQYLPEGVNYKNDRLEVMLKGLAEKKINYVYTAPALIEASKELKVYNVKYDAGHWNDHGAFVGISIILKNLQNNYPSLSLPKKEDYDISYELRTSLPVSYHPIREEVPVYTLKNPQTVRLDTYKDEIKLNETGWYYSYCLNPNKPTAPKILVFMGSYFLGKEKYIAESFSKTVFVHSYKNIQDIDYYFNIFQPDIVLFQTVDYATKDLYYPLNLIRDVEYSPAYNTMENLPTADFASVAAKTGQEWRKVALDSDRQLVDFTIPVSGDRISYAYAQINDEFYDFRVVSQQGEQMISITLDKNIILSARSMQIILISADKTMQRKIPLDFGLK